MSSRYFDVMSSLAIAMLFLLGQSVPGLAEELFDPAVDPYPMPMPAEYGCAVSTTDTWMVTSSNVYVLDVEMYGYYYGSLQYQSVMAQMGGMNQNAAVMQLSYTNYTVPSSPTAGTMISYDTQACYNNPIEGDTSYPGPNYYIDLMELYYNAGLPVYFSYVTVEGYGVCLQYTVNAPWNNPDLPRDINYTLTFQNSTGYLLDYVLSGTEYCCFGEAGGGQDYCPNSGNCTDGSAPQQVYTISGTYYRDYELFTDWPVDFFTSSCPFSITDDDNGGSGSSGTTYSTGSIAGIVLGSMLGGIFLSIGISYILQRQKDGNSGLDKPLLNQL